MIEYKPLSLSRTYYVIFDKRRGDKRWWNLFTSRGFDHVWMLTPLKTYGTITRTLAILPMPGGCIINEWGCNIKQALQLLPKDTTAILKYTTSSEYLRNYHPSVIMSCISHCKYLLGVRGWFAITPYRLYLRLKQLGAEEI